MALTNDEILEAIKGLNNNYGYGDVTGIKFYRDLLPYYQARGEEARGHVTITGYGMRPKDYRFKVVGRTVYFRGRQRHVQAEYWAEGQIYNATRAQDEDGPKFIRSRPLSHKRPVFEYVMTLMHAPCGQIVDEYDSAQSGPHLTWETARKAVREVVKAIEAGMSKHWFTITACNCQAQKKEKK
jgi:hypothetical protein